MAIPKTQKGGGPNSAEGKAVVSRNAIKTGAYAVQHLLPGEDPSQYEELLEQFQNDFRPQDVAESAMVRDLAILTWKQLRVENYQHTMLMTEFRKEVSVESLRSVGFALPSEDHHGCAMMVFEDYFEKEVKEQKQLEKLHEESKGLPTKEFLVTLKKKFPEHFQGMLEQLAEDHEMEDADPAYLEEGLLTVVVPAEIGVMSVSYVTHYFRLSNEYRSELFWAHENQDEIRQAVQAVKARRAMLFMQGSRAPRMTDDLQRAFYRTLNELRRHQNWRRTQMVVDVTPLHQIEGATGD